MRRMSSSTAPEKVHKFISRDLKIRVGATITTEIVQKMCSVQGAFPLAAIAMGRTLTGAILMASQLKRGHRIGLYFRGDGPLGSLFAEANFEGEARGYVNNPSADLPLSGGHIDVPGGIGKGTLTVTRTMPFQKQPHNGIVPIETGTVSEDIAYYLFQSFQVPSVVSRSVPLDGDGSVLAAGGVLVEVMPGADETLISILEARARSAPSLSKRILAGDSPLALATAYAHDSELIEVEHDFPISYTCRCTRERVDRTLYLLGRAALAEMVLKGEDVPVVCQFCGQTYTVTKDDLRKIQQALQ